MSKNGARISKFRQTATEIMKSFDAIEKTPGERIQVGVVGEIYVKYSPLGNNNLVDFLVNEGAECTVPGLLDFCLYYIYHHIAERGLYGLSRIHI